MMSEKGKCNEPGCAEAELLLAFRYPIIIAMLFVCATSITLAGKVQLEIAPHEQRTNAILFSFEGTNYTPPKVIQGTHSRLDKRNPENVAEMLYTFIKSNDVASISTLYLPGEGANAIRLDANDLPNRMLLFRRIEYGPFVVLDIGAGSVTNIEHFFLSLTQKGADYFLTDQLEGDDALQFVQSCFGLDGVGLSFSYSDAPFPRNYQNQLRYSKNDTAAKNPIMVSFRHEKFESGREIKLEVTESTQNLKTPESALNAIYSALKAKDGGWYARLVEKSELTNKVVIGGGSVHQYVTDHVSTIGLPGNNLLMGTIYFGDCAILQTLSVGFLPDWLVLRKTAEGWRLTNKLNGHPAWTFLLGAKSEITFGYPKVFPEFKKTTKAANLKWFLPQDE
jgi:hypothetical protein